MWHKIRKFQNIKDQIRENVTQDVKYKVWLKVKCDQKVNMPKDEK